ncbi:MAG TPA: hypothetical protein VFV62_07770 [Gaiellaceae bacterium]|nr:hypothetical protein [Gaiellaceae bacterium]
MTQLALPTSARSLGLIRTARIGAMVATTVLAGAGLVIASVGISFPIVEGVLASGRVVASPRDIAIFESIAPYWGAIVLFGLLQVAGAVGALDQGRIGRLVAIGAAGILLIAAVGTQLAATAGTIELDVAGRAVAATMSGLAGIALLGVGISARR